MSCWCGGPGHHWGPGHGYGYGPGVGYGPGYGPGVVHRPRRRRTPVEDLEEYLQYLEDEVAAVRAELEEAKERRTPEGRRAADQ